MHEVQQTPEQTATQHGLCGEFHDNGYFSSLVANSGLTSVNIDTDTANPMQITTSDMPYILEETALSNKSHPLMLINVL